MQNLFTQVLLKGSDPNLASIYENNTPNIVKQAIDKATPILLGLPKSVGITANIQNALLGLDQFLKSGIDKVKEWANQPDMFNDGLAPQDFLSPLDLVMIEQMAKAKRIIDVLNPIKEYAKLVTEQPASLFEEAAQPLSKEQALKQVYGTEKSMVGTTERTPRLQEKDGGTQQETGGTDVKGQKESPADREKVSPTKTQKVDEGQAKPIGESPQDVTGNIGTDKDAAEKTKDQRKAEVAARVDKLADKIKAKLGTDPNVVKMGLGADDIVDFIAEVVKDLANLGIDAAEAIKTAKAKLKELGVSDALINEGEAKYTGKEQAIPTEIIDDLLGSDANKRRNAKRNLPTETLKETATAILKDNDIEAIFQEDTDESLKVLAALEKKLGIKKICK
jgi:hypothetical protein